MSDDILARLQQIQGHTLKLQAAMQSQPKPSEGHGTDPSGCVGLVVDPDGLPSRIEVRAGWQRHVAAAELGPLVLLVFQETAAQATQAWSESFDLDAWRSRAEAARAGEREGAGLPPLQQARPFGSPRDPLTLTEEALKALKATRDQAAAPPVTVTGWDGDRAVSITLTPGGLQGCTINPRWALRQGASALNAALREALRAARAAIEEHAARRRAEAQGLDDLAREALATLARFQDFNNPPEEG
ncbi:hypothetical protein C7C45_06070 [Micromonospora arborensis]|uniref:YbaB/EbfC family DNA-binding protein n=1 Tax=Micromonospora arborensis TaxID=2116518 RepID=A0A318NS46_9ACTN|nr:hypothetical protein [Micromonospora arborensis]PYC73898.1 hypothetical protein C7C45_06070 [Micromonospora arborensis]